MRLHDYATSGNCYKVRLLLALLGREVERVPVDIFAGDTLTDAFGRLNPLRETPVLELDDGSAIAQSNAILWFLAEGTPYLPDDAAGRARVVQWLSFEQEWIMRGVAGARFRLVTGRDPDRARQAVAAGAKGLQLLDAHLAAHPFVLGDRPTIADLSLYAYAHVAPEAGLAVPPAVAAWIERIEALPGFMNDLAPYPDNAQAGRSRSIYD